MTEKAITETVRAEEMTLSQLIWRVFRRQPVGYLERVLTANPRLSLVSPYLPVGAVVVLPVEAATTDAVVDDVIRLWD